MEFLTNFFLRFVEIRHFGLNTSTVAFVGTLFFGLSGAWGIRQQINKVEQDGSEGVSVIQQMILLTLFTSFGLYGFTSMRLALLFQAACRVPFYLILLACLKAKRPFSRGEWTFQFALALLLGLLGTYDLGIAMMALNYLGAFFSADQPRMLYRLKKTGSLAIKLVWIYFTSCLSWLLYGGATQDYKILLSMTGYFFVYLTTIILYYRYRGTPEPAAA